MTAVMRVTHASESAAIAACANQLRFHQLRFHQPHDDKLAASSHASCTKEEDWMAMKQQ